MLLPHRRLLLRPLLVLLLLPQVVFNFLVSSTLPLLVPQALRQPAQAAPTPVAQPEQEGDPLVHHLLTQRELDGTKTQH